MKKKLLWVAVVGAAALMTGCDLGNDGTDDADDRVKVPEYSEPTERVMSEGFYVANEDWFGHDVGTVNYFKRNGDGYDISYRVYRVANPDEGDWLGNTTQFATVWGENIYFCSKQGNCLVVADAATMKKKAILTDLGGDGRFFVGVDDRKAYVGHANGIASFDITEMKIGRQVVLPGGNAQTGNMCAAGGRVFAISQGKGVYVIDPATDEVIETIAGSYNTLACSRDGDVWVAASDKLIRIEPATLGREEVAYPEGTSISGTWWAWNAGSMCASTQNNVLYWTQGKNIVKYDVDTRTANTSIYTIGKSEHDVALSFYGAGMRVDPLTDELVLTVKHSGWGDSGAYNWIHVLDADGNLKADFKVRGDNGSGESWAGNAEDWDGKYFWFPAIPFFEDANKPQILLNRISLKTGEEKVIDLDDNVVDYDNTQASIIKTVEPAKGGIVTAELVGSMLTVSAGDGTGSTSCVITAVSNGVRVDKTVEIEVVR